MYMYRIELGLKLG